MHFYTLNTVWNAIENEIPDARVHYISTNGLQYLQIQP